MDGSGARRRTFVTALTLAVALALALPAFATAQSAGDEQYADPLAGDRSGEAPQSGGGGGAGGGQADAPAPAPSAPSATPAPSGDTGATVADGRAAATSADGGTLPRTGAEPAPLAAAGLLLALAGILLRRRMPLRARA